jgi:predicted nucleic acid-binding Zn ribbon protein
MLDKDLLKNSPRRGNTVSFKDAFDEMLKTLNLRKKYKEQSVMSYWRNMMGEAITERTLRVFIKERVLYVELSSAPLKQELGMAKKVIINQLNQAIGEKVIDEILFL